MRFTFRIFSFAVFTLFILVSLSGSVFAQESTANSYQKTFTISAYYSPLPGQQKYATGSYEADIRLNGNGTNGADGTEVYPGMIAAPKTYAFGTKMHIPGIGVVAVHDRGGAIVNAGERNQAFDRLDIWMGFGDAGLKRALSWGKKDLPVTVYGIDPTIQENAYLEGFSIAESFVKNVILAPQLFNSDIWVGSEGEDVERLQRYMSELGYFKGVIDGFFGEELKSAVTQFQLDKEVIDSADDFAAGHVGVNTRKALDAAVSGLNEEKSTERLQRYQKGLLLLDRYPDLDKRTPNFHRTLTLNMLGDDVERLQENLATLGYLGMEPTGFFGDVTEHAVYKFQQRMEILESKDDLGAGVFGPQTRTRMNQILGNRVEELSFIAVKRDAIEEQAAILAEEGHFARTLAVGDRGSDVEQLQSLLNDLGFFTGLFVTEFYGDQTKSAVTAFQLANGLIESEEAELAGILDAGTREHLNGLF